MDGLTKNLPEAEDKAQAGAFADSVEVCSKCCRKLGPEGKDLRKALKRAIGEAFPDVEVEKTDCFSLCPKNGQVVAAYGRGGRRLVILQPGSDVGRAAEYLLGGQQSDG